MRASLRRWSWAPHRKGYSLPSLPINSTYTPTTGNRHLRCVRATGNTSIGCNLGLAAKTCALTLSLEVPVDMGTLSHHMQGHC